MAQSWESWALEAPAAWEPRTLTLPSGGTFTCTALLPSIASEGTAETIARPSVVKLRLREQRNWPRVTLQSGPAVQCQPCPRPTALSPASLLLPQQLSEPGCVSASQCAARVAAELGIQGCRVPGVAGLAFAPGEARPEAHSPPCRHPGPWRGHFPAAFCGMLGNLLFGCNLGGQRVAGH